MKKKLAIICADKEQIDLVNKAKEMGIETHCFSWDKEGYNHCKGIADYFHPISIIEKEQILEKCRKINIDGITSIRIDYAVPTVAFVAQNMGLPGNRYDDMITALSKHTMRQAFYQHGVKTPRFVIARKDVDLYGFRYPVIVKAVDRNSSEGVIKVECEKDLQDAVNDALNASICKEAIIEEFITGVIASVDTISYCGKHYIITTKDNDHGKSDNLFQLLGRHYPSSLDSEIQEKMKAETIKALDAINFMNGVCNMQFIVTEKGEVFSLEPTPRLESNFGALCIKLSNGYDVIKGVIDVAMGQFKEPVFEEKKYSGFYYFCKETEWVKKVIENKKNDIDIIRAEFEDVKNPNLGEGRLGYFIYQSKQRRHWNSDK